MNVMLIIAFLSFILCTNIALSEDVSYLTNVNTTNSLPENFVVLHLDENMNRILFDLFVEVFGNNNDKVEVPVSLVGEIYRNYTQEQLDSLKSELKNFDSSFDVIRQKVDLLQQRFIVASIEYDLNRNLSQFENRFIQIGEELLILQKLVLKLSKNDKSTETHLEARQSSFFNIFDRLAGLLLGINTGSSYQSAEPFSSGRLNQVVTLMRALQSINNIPTNTKIKSNSDLIKLQNMLSRLQQIQALNKLANMKQSQKSETINPYRYEAVLNLVKLVGTASGANQLRTLLRIFNSPNTKNKVKNTNNISQEKLKILMRAIEEQEQKRQKEFEANQQKEILNNILKNQREQQEQINNLMKMIEAQNKKGTNDNTNNNSNKVEESTPKSSTDTSSSNRKELVNKLREQRQQLNNLLKTLGQTNGSWGSAGQTSDTHKTQQVFTDLLKNIGPMMGALAQSGIMSQKQSQLSQKSLSDLLKAASNTNLQNDSTKSIIQRLLEELQTILDESIYKLSNNLS